jgi:hypothetical protein
VRLRSLLVVVGLAAAAALAAGLYCAFAAKRYEARAELLVSPVAAGDETFAGLGVLRRTSEPRRAVETVAGLVRTPEVAEAVRLQLGSRDSRSKLLDAVSARPGNGSDLVGVVGKASSPARAAQIANAFATELVAQRAARFQGEVLEAVARLRRELRRGGASGAERTAEARRLAVLNGLVGRRDPTIQVASAAAAPAHASWPRPWLLVPLAAAAGAALGLVLVLARRRRPRPGEVETPELARREALVEQRLEAVTRAERDLARRAGALAARERELAEAPAAAPPPPEPEPEPEPAPRPAGGWNLNELERLVGGQAAEQPERAAEWTSYLFHLRDHADAGGRLPSSFDGLVEEVFGDLAGRDAALKGSVAQADQGAVKKL